MCEPSIKPSLSTDLRFPCFFYKAKCEKTPNVVSLGVHLYTWLGLWQFCTNQDKASLDVLLCCDPTTSSEFSQRNLVFPSSYVEQIKLIFELPQGALVALPNFH